MKRIVTLAILFIASTCFAQMYTITDLGTLSPAAINNLGQIAAVNLNKHAVVRTAGRVRDLGLLPGGTYSIPTGINDVGAVVGTADVFYSGYWTGSLPVAFVWTSSQGMTTVGYIPVPVQYPRDYPTSDFGTGINIFGQVIVDAYCCTYINGYVWTQRAGLAMVVPYTYNAEALGINNRGQVVGWNGVAPMGQGLWSRASLWDNGVLTELGSFLEPSDPVFNSCALYGFLFSDRCGSVAYAINDAGQIVGWSAVNLYNSGFVNYSDYTHHAFLWTQADGMTNLGTLPNDLSSVAKKINALGQVIGWSSPEAWSYSMPDNSRPFIWTQKKGMQDLNTLIPANSGWVLESVADINFWGQIVGQGTRNGQTHGFLLTPRTPFGF